MIYGAIVDAFVLSGNHDDKNCNQERIAELGEACDELKKLKRLALEALEKMV